MARRPGQAARRQLQAERLRRLEAQSEKSPIESSATEGLWTLHQAYTREVQHALAPDRPELLESRLSLLDEDDDDEESAAASDNSHANFEYKVSADAPLNFALTGLLRKDASHATAAAGCGRGVPANAKIEQCAIIASGKGRPAVVVTAASDGENVLRVPSSGWQMLGFVPFVSVFSRFAGEPCRRRDLQKVIGRGDRYKEYGRDRIETFLATSLGGGMRPTTAPSRTRKDIDLSRKRALLRELDARVTQDSHLDVDRENNMAKVMFTTIVRDVNFGIVKHVYDVLDDKKLQCVPDGIETGSGVPNTPRGVVELIRERRCGSSGMGVSPKAPGSSRRNDQRQLELEYNPALRLPPTCAEIATASRDSLQLSCVASHPELPQIVAGIGDGQLAVYQLYRAHGERRTQLHQTQGFDASRRRGDVASALHVPIEPLAQEGSLGQESFIAGFVSGRVAVFRIFSKPDVAGNVSNRRKHEGRSSKHSLVLENRNGGRSIDTSDGHSLLDLVTRRGTHEPNLLPEEPLLLNFSEIHSGRAGFGPIVCVLWRPSVGILSISAQGMVIAADINGSENWRIPCVCGVSASVSVADISVRLEQLAAAGQRGEIHLWQCLTQTHANTLDAGTLKSPVLLVRYLPSHTFLASVHEADGLVLVWDLVHFELRHVVRTPDCLRASCAAWDALQSSLFIFGPKGVTERRLCEQRVISNSAASIEAIRYSTWIVPSNSQLAVSIINAGRNCNENAHAAIPTLYQMWGSICSVLTGIKAKESHTELVEAKGTVEWHLKALQEDLSAAEDVVEYCRIQKCKCPAKMRLVFACKSSHANIQNAVAIILEAMGFKERRSHLPARELVNKCEHLSENFI